MLFIISSNGFNLAHSCYISYIIHSRLAKCFLRQKLKAALYLLIEFSLKANISLLASLKPTGLQEWKLIGANLKKKKTEDNLTEIVKLLATSVCITSYTWSYFCYVI